MKQAGFVYALYLEGQFIEHFKTTEDAKIFCQGGNVQGDQKVVIKPVVYFTCKRSEK